MRHQRTVHRGIIDNTDKRKIETESLAPRNLQSQSMKIRSHATNDICKWCDFHSTNKHKMIEHIRHAHKTIEIFTCDQCDYCHYIRDRFNRHRRYYRMQFIYCEYCEFKTIYKWNMVRHGRHHRDSVQNDGFHCEKCNFVETMCHRKVNSSETIENSDGNLMDFLELDWHENDSGETNEHCHLILCQNCNFKWAIDELYLKPLFSKFTLDLLSISQKWNRLCLCQSGH